MFNYDSKNKQLRISRLTYCSLDDFVGLCIEAGALIVNFIFSLYKPEFVHNLYQKLDLYKMYTDSKWGFSEFIALYSPFRC